MNASVERSALHLILATFVHAGPADRARTEPAVKKALERALHMGVLEIGTTSEEGLEKAFLGAAPKSEIMDTYLDVMSGQTVVVQSSFAHPGPGVICTCPLCVPDKPR